MKFVSKNFRKIALLVGISVFSITGCLQNPSLPEITVEIPDAAMILKYFESKGNIINTKLVPPTFRATDIQSYSDIVSVIDLRDKDQFMTGRIPNSVNVRPDSIFKYVQDVAGDSNLVVLVSETGELSAYISTLFWFMDYYNVYSLQFGIASWHEDFGNQIIEELEQRSLMTESDLTNDEFAKSDFSPLPELNLGDLSDIGEIVRKRCSEAIDDLFIINSLRDREKDSYLICYGNLNLYKAHARAGPSPGMGHPPGAVHYQHALIYDLESHANLQTIPSNKQIIIYSFSGQLAACTVAYLRILGYDAYSLRYGGSQLAYKRLLWNEFTRDEIFSVEDIMNFDYDKN
ncbi:MAG: rhodanese-like domain-containing protein [Melioribacteraceae bacterium]|nr:rhodanese-like domain-containing protein [Melioribacteraceae bacterium]